MESKNDSPQITVCEESEISNLRGKCRIFGILWCERLEVLLMCET